MSFLKSDLNTRLRWYGTVSYLIGMALTSYNVFPLYLWFQVLGGATWTWASIMAKDKALFVNEAAAILLYGSGMAYHYL